MLLDVPPALSDLAEDCGVAADDDDARHQEAEEHQELLRGTAVLPENNEIREKMLNFTRNYSLIE